MSMVYILLPLALLVAGVMLALFIRAARSGQFDDLETPARRILHDDEEPVPPPRSPPSGGRGPPGEP
jgi:cbb3-type cytochrome oxidase maturation protein